MKKLLILTLILVLTGCSAYGEYDNDVPMEGQMQKANMQVEEGSETTTEAVDTRIEQVNEIGWYIYELDTISINTSNSKIAEVVGFSINPEYNSAVCDYKIRVPNADGIVFENYPLATPTKAVFKDEFGNIGTLGSLGNTGAGAYKLDLASKTFTIELEFDDNPEVGDVTITITLP